MKHLIAGAALFGAALCVSLLAMSYFPSKPPRDPSLPPAERRVEARNCPAPDPLVPSRSCG